MKKLLIALALTLGVALSCNATSDGVKPPPSPTVTGPTGPVEALCTDFFTHLGSGGKLTMTGSATTAYIGPNVDNYVFVFVGQAPTSNAAAPIPALEGGGVEWTRLGTWWKKPDAPRNMSVFYAIGVQPGTLTISGLPVPKTHVAWSISQGGNTIVQWAANPVGGLETQHSVTLDNAPVGAVVAGFLVGQQGVVDDIPPYVSLGQGHTSLITEFSEWDVDGPGDYQTASAIWAQGGHSIGAAVEVACAEEPV